MLDAVEDAVFLCDPRNGSVLDANRAGRRLLNQRSERAGEPSISDWSAGSEGYDAARAHEALQRASGGHVERLAWRAQRDDGSRFWAELRLSRAEGPGDARVVAILRDTTELERSEERQRAIADATFEGIAIVHEGRILDANEQLGALYGGSRTALIGHCDRPDRPRVARAGALHRPAGESVPRPRPEEAVRAFELHHAQLAAVLCDLVMPALSGTDATVRMREIDPHVPVVLCSGYPRDERSRGAGPVSDAFLPKPFHRSELSRVLSRVARRTVRA